LIEVVKVGKLKTNRDISPGDNLEELEKSLREDGLLVPLLVNGDMIVVDGVRRLTAIKKLGYKDAICQVTTDFDVAMASLIEAKAAGGQVPLTPRRLIRQYQLISKMGEARLSERRATIPLKRNSDGSLSRSRSLGRYKDEYKKLVGVAESLLQEMLAVYRHFDRLDPKAPGFKDLKQILDRAEAGEVPIAQVNKLHRIIVRGEYGHNSSLQSQILSSTISTMQGMATALASVDALSPDLDREEVKVFITEARKFIRKLRSTTNSMGRQLNE
jgi:hypothetical protein